MIISRTPFRLSFFGGGTDYPAWYLREGGAVLSTTIDKYCHISVRYLPPFFPNQHRVVWSYVETVSTIGEILHPAVREGLRFMGFDDSAGLDIHHWGDLPARSGMGSSSAFAVGLVKALAALRGQMIGKHELALKAMELEQMVLREHVGSQDQVASAYGGFNLIEFAKTGDVRVEPVTVPAGRLAELERRMLLFYTGSSRLASDIAADVMADLAAKRGHLLRLRAMVDDAIDILCGGDDLDAFGKLLHQGWQVKRQLSPKVASPIVEKVYRKATKAGALGGKLLGAGSAGFMAFYVPEKKQLPVIRELRECMHVPFRFEPEGSRIIYYGPQPGRPERDAAAERAYAG
jgi:D-glycero-alpha-D-manno-heptose-7-phosphate kinase